ncbi:MAG: hypothetical protein JWM10_724 [Myxococcaceae bacterium]|nr:hypothetical protein [Myxococcaceae bacterium]
MQDAAIETDDEDVAAPPEDEGDGWRPFTPKVEVERPTSRLAELLRNRSEVERLTSLDDEISTVRATDPMPKRYLASLLILRDLIHLGWHVRVHRDAISVRPHQRGATPAKQLVRRQLLHGRDDQLQSESVQRFVEKIERPSRGARHKSVLHLIADGKRIADDLRVIAEMPRATRPEALRKVCCPYIQIATSNARDPYTGLNLFHVWRYFRYTWSSRYRRPPGRHIAFLIRDASRPFHPIMAITALSSAVLQLTARDEWIGWTVHGLLALIEQGEVTDDEVLDALRRRVREDLANLYTEDLGFDGASPPRRDAALDAHLGSIAEVAQAARLEGLRTSAVDRKVAFDHAALIAAARTPLFRAKRANTARILLRLDHELAAMRAPLRDAVLDARAKNAMALALRQVKQHFAAASVMDIATCGAVPPYGPLLAGKLACMLMLTPFVRDAVKEAYQNEPSVIASQMAGRPLVRSPELAMVTTTSLYPERSSQYNRVKVPAGTLAEQPSPLGFREVGRSLGHGSTNLSVEAEEVLAEVAAERRDVRNVNFVFGEGQSAKLRELREATVALNLSDADLIQHGSPRIVYVAPLIECVRRVLLGVSPRVPRVVGDDGVEAVAEFWRSRWLASRVDHGQALVDTERKRPHELLVSRLGRADEPDELTLR